MVGEELSDADGIELRRRRRAQQDRYSLGMIAVLFSGLAVMAILVATQLLSGHLHGKVSGSVLFLPAALVGMAALLVPPLWKGRKPQDRIDLKLMEKADRQMLWLWPAQSAVTVVGAIGFARRPEFTVLLFAMPLIIVATVLARYRRSGEDFSKAVAAQALADGFLAAFFCLSGLMLVAWFAADWLVRVTPLALASTASVAACSFALRSLRAERER